MATPNYDNAQTVEQNISALIASQVASGITVAPAIVYPVADTLPILQAKATFNADAHAGSGGGAPLDSPVFTTKIQTPKIGVGVASDSEHNLYAKTTTIPTSPTGNAFTPHLGELSGAWQPNISQWGLMGNAINTGSAVAGTGHGGGVVGRSQDTTAGTFTMYGVEGRVDAQGTAGGYGAVFAFANYGAAAFSGALSGVYVRSEIYNSVAYTTPLAQGVNVGVRVDPLVGGAVKLAFYGKNDVRIDGGKYVWFDAAGTNYGTVEHDGDSTLITNVGGTGGFLKLRASAGAYVAVDQGLGMVFLNGLKLGVDGLAPDITARTFASKMTTVTYASPTSIDPTLGNTFKTTTVNATGSVTFNAAGAGQAGQQMKLVIVNDATGAKTITFGTNFRAASTLVGTVSKAATISFISDGTAWYETGRSLVL